MRSSPDRLLVTTELRATFTPDGAAWATSGFVHDHWTRTANGYGRLLVAMRASDADEPAPGAERIEGPGVEVLRLPELRLDRHLPRQLVTAARALDAQDAMVLLTVPGVVGSLALLVALVRRRPFAVQVVGDPLDVTLRAGVGGPARVVVGAVLAATQRLACRRAVAARYVTDRYLQRRYPPGLRTVACSVSNVIIPAPAPGGPPDGHQLDAAWRLVTVASLDQPYKRVDLLLDAVAVLRAEGWDLHLDVVGAGAGRSALEARAGRPDLAGSVTFWGAVPRARVDEVVAAADLFVLCSDTEGMPRALIEAMAAARACIGSSVGGVPELLPPEARFTPGSLASLVGALRRHLVSGRLAGHNAAGAARRAADFAPDVLEPARDAFMAAVRRGAAP